MHAWFIITNAEGTILAVYGSALEDMALSKLGALNKLCPTNRLHKADFATRPRVGEFYVSNREAK